MSNLPRHTIKSIPVRLICILPVILCILILAAPRAFAKTYVITDGNRVITYTTLATDPAEILSQAGMSLEDHDSHTTADGETIALHVQLLWRGEAMSVTSEGETVAQLLDRLGLEATPRDTLSHPLDSPVTDGMVLQVDSTITRQETYATTIPHEVYYCADTSLPVGTEEVLIRGRDGELLHTAEVTYLNGQEVHREELTQTQTIAPITEVIAQGTAQPEAEEPPAMPVIEDGYIIMPSGEILTYCKTDYVTATGYTHTDAGCDMITSTGTTVHYGTAAVDPRFIPYGTRMLIVSLDGERYYGIATAEDCGGAIKRDRMDLYFPTYNECIEFGRRRCIIYFLG